MWRWLRRYLAEEPAASPGTAEPGAGEKDASGIVSLASQVLKDRDQAAVLKETVAGLAGVFDKSVTHIAVVCTACACTLIIVVVGAACVVIWVADKELGRASLHYTVPLGFASGGLVITVTTIIVKRKIKRFLTGILDKGRGSKAGAE